MRLSWSKSLLLMGALVVGAAAAAALQGVGGARGEGREVAALLPSRGSPPLAHPGALRIAPWVAAPGPAMPGPAAPGPAAQGPATPGHTAPRTATRATATWVRELVFRLGWGSGPQQLGFQTPEEGAPEGPASFALGPDGSVWVLDQVNFRVQVVRGGRVAASVPLLNDTYQDLAVDDRGRLALVDRLVLRHLAWLDGAGQAWRFADLEGTGLPEGGGVTALFLRPDGAWLEWAHTHLVRVTDAQGRPDARRPVRWGRVSADGGLLLRASRAGSHGAVVLTRDARSARTGVHVLAKPSFERPLAALFALGSDSRGRVVLGARLVEQGMSPPFPVLAEEAWALVLGADGAEVGRLALAVSRGPTLPFQSLRVGPDGSIYHLAYEEGGAALWRVRP